MDKILPFDDLPESTSDRHTVAACSAFILVSQAIAAPNGWYSEQDVRRIGFRQGSPVFAAAADPRAVDLIPKVAPQVVLSPRAETYLDRNDLRVGVNKGIQQVRDLFGGQAAVDADVSVDHDDGSEILVLKIFAELPYKEILAKVRQFNIAWQNGDGDDPKFDSVLFMAGLG